MASSISVKPVIGGLQVGVERAGPARSTASTELSDAVGASTASDLVRRDPLRAATLQAEMHDLVLDAQNREVISQAIEWSRRTTRQAPAVVARRLAAYSRPTKNPESPRDDHADIEV